MNDYLQQKTLCFGVFKLSRVGKRNGHSEFSVRWEDLGEFFFRHANLVQVFLSCFPLAAQEKEVFKQESRGKHSMGVELN